MLDVEFVGALVRGDISPYSLDAADVQELARQRVVTDTRRALKVGPATAVTDDAAELLSEILLHRTLASRLQARAANDVSQILAAAEIPALVYKGVALAAVLHSDWRGRESADVDVLIAPGSVVAAHHALSTAGLRRSGVDQGVPSRFHRFRAIEVGYNGLPAAIDLHWQVESPGYFGIAFEDMWSRRQRLRRDGLEVWTPAVAELLLIAAVHGTRELWRSLRHILDFAQLATLVTAEQWEEAVALSAFGPRKSLAIALAVAQKSGVTQLPAQPGNWALRMADEFLDPLKSTLNASGGSVGTPRRSPSAAIRRRIRRWQAAPNTTVAVDGFVRSVLRQVGYDGPRSWDTPWNSDDRATTLPSVQLRCRHL